MLADSDPGQASSGVWGSGKYFGVLLLVIVDLEVGVGGLVGLPDWVPLLLVFLWDNFEVDEEDCFLFQRGVQMTLLLDDTPGVILDGGGVLGLLGGDAGVDWLPDAPWTPSC